MKILLVDNYDSFTWNLHHYLSQLVLQVDVYRNDDEHCFRWKEYDGVVISPGPGLPADSGYTPRLIGDVTGTLPLLGICLGHQAIVEHFGGKLINLPEVLHGKQRNTTILNPGSDLFKGLPAVIQTGHYHSWVADPSCVPGALEVLATDQDGHVMAVTHKQYPVMGLQFHPESIMTPLGFTILRNWINHLVQHEATSQ